MGISMGVIIGVVVLLLSIGFVVLMMVSEWSQPPAGKPLAENPAAAVPQSARRTAAKKAAKKPAKKAAKKAKKKR